MGQWGIQPGEFWAMTLREWWLVFDSKIRDANAAHRARQDESPYMPEEEREYLLSLIRYH